MLLCLCALRSGTSHRAKKVNRRNKREASHNRVNHKVSECEKKDNAKSDIKDKFGESST